MIVVAGDQHESMPANVVKEAARRIRPYSGNLSAIVDRECPCEVQSRIGRNDRIQVDDLAVLPQDGVLNGKVARQRLAHDLTP